ncbi:MAG: hypothetical protein WD844_11170 [Thermoleophilaceae bacterium]
MTRPEDALDAARAAASRRRAEGGYAEPEGLEEPPVPERPSLDQLREWALIEVDPSLVYSTRRLGGPVTFAKRMLLRLLRQYTTELEAQQTRFNVGVLGWLEERERERDPGRP